MSFTIRTEIPEDDFTIEQIVKSVFGPGRLAKTAYRLREAINYQILFGLVTENHLGKIVATVRVAKLEGYTDTVILGPIAVNPDMRNIGLGMALMKEAEKYCHDFNVSRIVLVGDPEYYKRFDYYHDYALDITLPGPVDKSRILGKILK